MKKRIFIATIAIILIAIFASYSALIAIPKSVANAAEDEAVYLFIDDPNHPVSDGNLNVTSNKQIGLYIHPFVFYGDTTLIYKKSFESKRYTMTNEITLFPIENGVTYEVCFYMNNINFLSDPVATITYDIEKPYITAETERTSIENNSTIIGELIIVKGHDNYANLKLFVSKNANNPQQCSNSTYEITEDGVYLFYAVDVAGNYSENFTITYYKQEPVKEPDKPDVPDNPITPTNPISPEEPIMDSQNTTAQDGGLIAIVVIVAVIIVGVTAFIIYRKVKAKSIHFEDDEQNI